MKRLALILIKVYKAAVSPYLPSMCKYEPTCSDYAAVAIEQHGVARGAGLGLMRLARCHPGRAGGYDPVPEPKTTTM